MKQTEKHTFVHSCIRAYMYSSCTNYMIMHVKLTNLCFRYDKGLLPPTMYLLFSRSTHITLEIPPPRIAASFPAQTSAVAPLDFWEFQCGKKFHFQFACP